jgi:hypothetical protein
MSATEGRARRELRSVMKAKKCAKDASSPAARFNAQLLKRLQRKLEAEPEIDIFSCLPESYSTTLKLLKGSDALCQFFTPMH